MCMRTISVGSGIPNRVTFTFKHPGHARGIRLVCKPGDYRPSGAAQITGKRQWLTNTPFLTADITDDSVDGRHKALFAIDDSADDEVVGKRALLGIGDYCTVSVPDEDGMLVAGGMRMPIVVIAENDENGLSAVYRRPGT